MRVMGNGHRNVQFGAGCMVHVRLRTASTGGAQALNGEQMVGRVVLRRVISDHGRGDRRGGGGWALHQQSHARRMQRLPQNLSIVLVGARGMRTAPQPRVASPPGTGDGRRLRVDRGGGHRGGTGRRAIRRAVSGVGGSSGRRRRRHRGVCTQFDELLDRLLPHQIADGRADTETTAVRAFAVATAVAAVSPRWRRRRRQRMEMAVQEGEIAVVVAVAVTVAMAVAAARTAVGAGFGRRHVDFHRDVTVASGSTVVVAVAVTVAIATISTATVDAFQGIGRARTRRSCGASSGVIGGQRWPRLLVGLLVLRLLRWGRRIRREGLEVLLHGLRGVADQRAVQHLRGARV